MSDTFLQDAASRLNDFLRAVGSANHVSVGTGKDVIHVYTKRKFGYAVPSIWEGFDVIHHKSGGAKACTTFKRLIDAQS